MAARQPVQGQPQAQAEGQAQIPVPPEPEAQGPAQTSGQVQSQAPVPSMPPAEDSAPASGQVQTQVPVSSLPQAQNSAQLPAQPEPELSLQSNPPEPSLKLNPLELLRRFQPEANEEYRLGKGDEIVVDFAGRPEMQAKVIVGPDGNISLPLAGEVKMAGLTRAEAANAVESSLKDYYANLEAQVSVTKYTANRVVLLGAVDHPGPLEFDGTPTLLEVLARGGVQTGPSKTDEPPGTNQIPERCAIYRGSDQMVWVELKAMVESGNTLADLRLRRDDIVYVPSMSDRFVSVLGEVGHPGAVPLTHSSTLASILAGAGGATEKAGNNPRIQIVDPATGTSRMLSFKDAIDPVKSLEVSLKPGEIIFVPRSGFSKFGYALQQLDPLVSVAMMGFYTGVL